MKRIGIFGGTSPESTALYYDTIINEYTKRYKDHNYPEILIYSTSFQRIIDWISNRRWDLISQEISRALNALHTIGADFGLIAAVTLHIAFNTINESVQMPLLNLIDTTAESIKKNKHSVVGLLGTKTTMTESFFHERLQSHGIKTLVPNEAMQTEINRILYNELTLGVIREESRQNLLEIIDVLRSEGAKGIILGCTEIPLLLKQKDTDIPLYDTSVIHAISALNVALDR